MNKRKSGRYIDFYRGIAVIMLIGSNITVYGQVINTCLGVIATAMIFVSLGMEYYYDYVISDMEDSDNNIFSYAFRKFLRPYIYFSLLLLFSQFVMKYGFGSNADIIESLIEIVSLNGMGFLWIIIAAYTATCFYRTLRVRFGFLKTSIIIIVLVLLYIPISNLPYMLEGQENIGRQLALSIFLMAWRTIIMSGFIALGELLERINKKIAYKHIVTVPLGIIFIGASCVCSYYNYDFDEYKYLTFGNVGLFIISAVLGAAGFLFICEWIGQFKYFEFFGRYFMLVAITHVDWGLAGLANIVDGIMLKIFDNDFVSRLSNCLVILVIEVLIIVLAARILYRIIGIEKENPFKAVAGIKEKNKDGNDK